MPSYPRSLVILAVAIVLVHVGAVGLLWTNGAHPSVPDSETAEVADNATALLAAAQHNDASLPLTSNIRTVDPADGTIQGRSIIMSDPTTGRLRVRTVQDPSSDPTFAEDMYLTGWGRWSQDSDGWTYESGQEAGYTPQIVRFLRPSPGTAESIEKTVHENGSVTIMLTSVNSGLGLPVFTGSNTTTIYRIAFHDDRPYFASAKAIPEDEDDEVIVVVDRTLGGTVDRPDELPPITLREVLDRLVAGALYE